MLSLRAFREEFITSGKETVGGIDDFADFDARRVRYDINWSMYESVVYRNVNDWATTYKTRYALYKYIRSIYNPSYRLGEFWKSHLWGGELDREAGPEGALPIITDNEQIREPLAQLWQWSNFAIVKDTITLSGAVLGDAFIRVVDDVKNGRVFLQYIHPATVAEVTKDERGNIKGYTIEEMKPSPISGSPVRFKEVASRGEGEQVIYRTYLNDSPFAWNGLASAWDEPYGFIPMVHIQHNDVGKCWGWAEIHPARSKIHEVDDLASMLSDQARKSINAKWFFAGLKAPTSGTGNIVGQHPTATTARPEPGRELESAIYSADPESKAYPLVAPLDIPGVVTHITEILKELERDYPELKFDNLRSSGTVSGAALRVARQPAETKVSQRRANYDNVLVRAQQMALSIGGFRGYFPGIGLDSFTQGSLDHNIGPRPVFYTDPLEKLQEESEFWKAAQLVVQAGGNLAGWLEKEGWTKEAIALVVPVRGNGGAGNTPIDAKP